ncbi:MAG: hypothetical protein ACOX05_04100 [Bacillota bacterium]|jgi:hypothetical protein
MKRGVIEFIDFRQATIGMIRSYKDKMFELEHCKRRLKELDARLTSTGGRDTSSPPVSGSHAPNDTKEKTIDDKIMLERQLDAINNYMTAFTPAWERLSDDEKELLEARYTKGARTRGIEWWVYPCRQLYISRSTAYKIADEALNRLVIAIWG